MPTVFLGAGLFAIYALYKTKNPYLKTVQSNMEEIAAFFSSKKIGTIFELNPGNHYTDTTVRGAAGIRRILEK